MTALGRPDGIPTSRAVIAPRVHVFNVLSANEEVTDVERCCYREGTGLGWCGFWRGRSLSRGFVIHFSDERSVVSLR